MTMSYTVSLTIRCDAPGCRRTTRSLCDSGNLGSVETPDGAFMRALVDAAGAGGWTGRGGTRGEDIDPLFALCPEHTSVFAGTAKR
jgi:hypothetical protein